MSKIELKPGQLEELARVTLRNHQGKYLDIGVCIHIEGALAEIEAIFRALNKDKEYKEWVIIDDLCRAVKIWEMKIHVNYEWKDDKISD